MTMRDRVAIVTGAGAGLGRSHALLLARHGARLVVNDVGEAADAVAHEIAAAGGEALAARGSVVDEHAVSAMVDAAYARWGRVDILVNNAGVLRDASFGKMSLADFRAVIDVHLMGSVICTKAVWNGMKAQNYGRIVMTTSSSGLFGNFGQANYGAAKMALVGLMQTLSIEGAKNDIRVNCLAPTAATAMTQKLLPDAMKDLMDPQLVSQALIHLTGDNAPTRAILCTGAGHFARAYVTLTAGAFVGGDAEAPGQVAHLWNTISDRAGETVPDTGSAQLQQELRSAMETKAKR